MVICQGQSTGVTMEIATVARNYFGI